ncbi:MAG: outer-membrane lipoprotein carrier protein LolA [Muribaculaceae bacterium]|nr:outer-membrane lipoprotein carrier protein LolA [Muribaculaceae bacterium]
MKTKGLHIITLLIGVCLIAGFSQNVWAATPASSLSARQIIDKTAATIGRASGMNVSFTLSSGGRAVKGALKAHGSKFALTTTSVSSWYNGRSMWTYNAGSKETTVITPTVSELAETNPLLLVSSGTKEFTAAFSKIKTKGFYNIVLSPKTKKSGMKSIHVTVNASTFLPSKIVAVPLSGGTITVDINSIKTGISLPASTFEYPRDACRNATIVDLR